MTDRPPLPPFTHETAAEKVRLAEDARNSRDPERVALAYTLGARWRNRAEFHTGRAAIVAFLAGRWAAVHDYRLIKELRAVGDDRTALRFACEFHDIAGNGFRAYGNESRAFAASGHMAVRRAGINDLAIAETDRLFRRPQGRRPDDHPGPSALGL